MINAWELANQKEVQHFILWGSSHIRQYNWERWQKADTYSIYLSEICLSNYSTCSSWKASDYNQAGPPCSLHPSPGQVQRHHFTALRTLNLAGRLTHLISTQFDVWSASSGTYHRTCSVVYTSPVHSVHGREWWQQRLHGMNNLFCQHFWI